MRTVRTATTLGTPDGGGITENGDLRRPAPYDV
jgi:hypothetical protein